MVVDDTVVLLLEFVYHIYNVNDKNIITNIDIIANITATVVLTFSFSFKNLPI
jgi:hypothetical protein